MKGEKRKKNVKVRKEREKDGEEWGKEKRWENKDFEEKKLRDNGGEENRERKKKCRKRKRKGDWSRCNGKIIWKKRNKRMKEIKKWESGEEWKEKRKDRIEIWGNEFSKIGFGLLWNIEKCKEIVGWGYEIEDKILYERNWGNELCKIKCF